MVVLLFVYFRPRPSRPDGTKRKSLQTGAQRTAKDGASAVGGNRLGSLRRPVAALACPSDCPCGLGRRQNIRGTIPECQKRTARRQALTLVRFAAWQ